MDMDYGIFCSMPVCEDQQGTLPPCAGLSVPYVPFQNNAPATYDQTQALESGTLFPGLDLPFHLKTKSGSIPNTPKSQLQALQFVVLELGTYLDTHPEDTEAFAMFRQYVELEEKAKAIYEENYGPLTRSDSARMSSYQWLKDPWPWNYPEGEV